MADTTGNAIAAELASPEERAQLRELTAGLIKAQGNRYIKDLLRDHSIRIGTKKEDFEKNLNEAIDSGRLTMSMIVEWLNGVEAWGNQHVYLFKLSKKLIGQCEEEQLLQKAKAAGKEALWNADDSLEFPEEARLTSIRLSAEGNLQLKWQEGTTQWLRDTSQDDARQVKGFDYQLRAYRKSDLRSVMRFEARPADRFAALFLADPIQGVEHQTARAEALRMVGLLMDGAELESGLADVSALARDFDQACLPSNRDPKIGVVAQKTRFGESDSYVEFASNSPERGYAATGVVGDVRGSIGKEQLKQLRGDGGVFVFQKTAIPVLAGPLRVQLYGGDDNRIRFWRKMTADEVWAVLGDLWQWCH